ncbi:MAG: lamin tail domain-containing protein [Actinomycetota bacterium]
MQRMTRALFLPLLAASVAFVAQAPATGASPDRIHPSTDHARGGPPSEPRRLRLNEVDYDQPGIDDREFVEIVNAGTQRYRLRRVALILVNGSTATEYRRIRLAGRLGPSRSLVLATGSVRVADGSRSLPLPLARDNLQNGSPDAIALFDTANRTVIDAVSYEGAITAATFEGVPRTWSLVQGTPVSESDSNEVVGTLCRLPDRSDTGDDDHDWAACKPTPGGRNHEA